MNSSGIFCIFIIRNKLQNKMKTILITGAAGNLGGLLAAHLADNPEAFLNLMIHNKNVSSELKNVKNIKIFKTDLADKTTIFPALQGVDIIVHFAGILFSHNPENFLPITNTIYFKNLVEVAIAQNVKRIILISFPHVEGETSIKNPAKGRLDRNPVSIHATTRLEEEKFLFEQEKTNHFEAVSLRVGMVYGKGILMIEGAKWFAKHKMLGIWRKPTCIHLISIIDFLNSTSNAALKDNIKGIYHLGDEGQQTLQEFLDEATKFWGYRKPVRMSVWVIMFVAGIFEFFSFLFNSRSPLTRDFIKIGMVSYYGDTIRMRSELLEKLEYKNFREGINTL